MLKKFSQKRLILLFVIALCLALVVTSVFSVTAVSAGQNEAKANDGSLLFEDNTEMSDNLAKAGNSNGSLDIKTDKPYDVVIVNDGVKQKVNVAQGTVADALNSVAQSNGFRADGFSASVSSLLQTLSMGLGQTLLLAGIERFGYLAPASSTQIIVQSEAIVHFFRACFSAIPLFGYLSVPC